MAKIELTQNYTDHSTDRGFQFEFFCDRCGSGYRTRFQPSALGTVSSALEAASSLFGGVLGRAADLGERARSASWEKLMTTHLKKQWKNSSLILFSARGVLRGCAARAAGTHRKVCARPVPRTLV